MCIVIDINKSIFDVFNPPPLFLVKHHLLKYNLLLQAQIAFVKLHTWLLPPFELLQLPSCCLLSTHLTLIVVNVRVHIEILYVLYVLLQLLIIV